MQARIARPHHALNLICDALGLPALTTRVTIDASVDAMARITVDYIADESSAESLAHAFKTQRFELRPLIDEADEAPPASSDPARTAGPGGTRSEPGPQTPDLRTFNDFTTEAPASGKKHTD